MIFNLGYFDSVLVDMTGADLWLFTEFGQCEYDYNIYVGY